MRNFNESKFNATADVLRGVPLPKPEARPSKYPFRDMLVSECYRLLPNDPKSFQTKCGKSRAYNAAYATGKKYQMKFQEVRVTPNSSYASQFPIGTVLIFRVA